MARTPEQLALNIQRQTDRMLNRLIEQVMEGHANREGQCTTVPMRRRRKNIRRVPKTALIALAAQRKMVRSQLEKLISVSVEHPGEFSQAIEVVNEFLISSQSAMFHGARDLCSPSQP